MKKHRKRLAALLALVAAVCCLLPACGGNAGGGQYAGDNKLSIFRWDFASFNNARKQRTPIYERMQEASGMRMEAVTTGSDWETKLNTLFGTGNLPDIFISKGPETANLYAKMIEDGALLPVSDYVSETEYPNLYRQLKKYDYLKTNLYYSKGKHWSIPVNWSLEHTMYIRLDWLENLNRPEKLRRILADEKQISEAQVTEDMLREGRFRVPQDLLEFYRVARAFTLYDPDGNGQNDTSGYAGTEELWSDNWVYNAFGAGWDFMIDADGDGSYEPSWVTDGAKKATAFLNRLSREGYMLSSWAEDDLTAKQENFVLGKVGMMEGHAWYNTILRGYIDANTTSVSKPSIAEAAARIGMFAPPKGPDGDFGITSNPDFWTVICINARISEEERTAALKLLDFMHSEEGNDLFLYGAEGTHFEWKDGERVSLMGQDNNGFNRMLNDVDSAYAASSLSNWVRDYYSPYQTNSDKIIAVMDEAKEYNRYADYPFLQTELYVKKWESLSDSAESKFYNIILDSKKRFMADVPAKLAATYDELVVYNAAFEEEWSAFVENYMGQMGGREVTNDYNAAVRKLG